MLRSGPVISVFQTVQQILVAIEDRPTDLDVWRIRTTLKPRRLHRWVPNTEKTSGVALSAATTFDERMLFGNRITNHSLKLPLKFIFLTIDRS